MPYVDKGEHSDYEFYQRIGERMTKIKLTDEEKETAFYVLHDLINDHDDQWPREEVDKLLEMFYYVANRRD